MPSKVLINVVRQLGQIPCAAQVAQAGRQDCSKQQEVPIRLSQKTAWLGLTDACYCFLVLVGKLATVPDNSGTSHMHDSAEIYRDFTQSGREPPNSANKRDCDDTSPF